MEIAVARSVARVTTASEALGARLAAPAAELRRSVALAAAIVADERRTAAMVAPLDAALEDAMEAADGLMEGDVLAVHFAVLAAAAAGLAWLAAPSPPACVSTAAEQAAPALAALRAMPDAAHAALADAVDSFLADLLAFVSAKHPNALQYVGEQAVLTPKGSTASTLASGPVADASHSAQHLVGFRETVVEGPLAAYVAASAKIGGIVLEQSAHAAKAVAGMYDFIALASQREKPTNDDDTNAMLAPLIAAMGPVAQIASDCPPRDVLYNHVTAIQEAMGMISWLVAYSKPISVVSDAEASASFYLSKLLMACKKQPDAADHQSFVEAIKQLFAAMKAYVKEHHTMGLRYNIGVAATSSTAKGASLSSSVAATDDDGESDSYVSAFKVLIDGPVAAYVKASNVLGGDVAKQAEAFAAAWAAEADFLSKAILMPKPDDIQDMLTPIATKMGEVGTIAEKTDPRGPLGGHCSAVAESVAALGWIAVDEKATAFVGDMAGAGQFFLDKVKMGARKTDDPASHRAWASSVETMFAELKSYVKEYHTQKLVWNPPKRVGRSSAPTFASTADDDDVSSDYVGAFKAIIDGPLAAYVAASNALGGDLAKQAAAFEGAWTAEAELLTKAIAMPKPDDIQDMLTPIATKMGEVGAIAEKTDPRGPLGGHCSAVAESVAALGWVAVDEKATAFVGDMVGAGQFFLDKVKMGARKTDNPENHRAWASALEALYAELKNYVKEYHTQKLVWNPPKRATRSAGRGAANVSSNGSTAASSNYVDAFKAIIDGPLATYVTTSNALGGDLAKQAAAFEGAWTAQAEFLSKAIAMPKPDDIQDMLTPIATKMGEVGTIAEKTDPRGPLGGHCSAVAESVAALGWVAVDEKATAFVGDMAGAGQFFLDKVKMGARKTDDPASHRAWAQSLETLFGDLKIYVKEHHTQSLAWGQKR